MSFQGDVAGIGLGELLQGLARGGRDGVLTLYGPRISTAIGLKSGQLFLLAGPDERETDWRERAGRAWAEDPSPAVETGRREGIARAERLEILYQMLEAPNLTFRFDPGTLPVNASARAENLRLDEAPASLESSWGSGTTVEYLLLEHARIMDESKGNQGGQLESYDVPRALDPSQHEPQLRDFLEQCDGRSTLQEIADRVSWPLMRCRLTVGKNLANNTLRMAQPRELLAAAQRELELGRTGRAASRLSGWVRSVPPGPPGVGDAELLVGEWERGRLQHVLHHMEASVTRALMRKLDHVHVDTASSRDRWRHVVEAHRSDELSSLHEAALRLVTTDDPDASTFHDLLKLARAFQDTGFEARCRTVLRLTASHLPRKTQTRIELGKRMLENGLVEDGQRWLLDTARVLIDQEDVERAMVAIRAVLKVIPDHGEATGLLLQTRSLLTKRKKRRLRSTVVLSVILCISLAGVVRFRSYQEVSRQLAEIRSQSSRPRAALARLDELFGSDDSAEVTKLRAMLGHLRREEEKEQFDAWQIRFNEVDEECRYGDPIIGLRRAQQIPPPPTHTAHPHDWSDRGRLFNALALRLETRAIELNFDENASHEELRQERRLMILLEDLMAQIEIETAPPLSSAFHLRLSELHESIVYRRGARMEVKVEIDDDERLRKQNILLATARSHNHAGDLKRSLASYDELIATEEGLAKIFAEEIQAVRLHFEAVKEAMEHARAGEHALAAAALVDGACDRPIEHLLPWTVTTRPSGAMTSIGGHEIRQTPFTMHSGVGEQIKFIFRLDKHSDREVQVSSPGNLTVDLFRFPERLWDNGHRVEAAPVSVGDDHVLADRRGRVVRLNSDSQVVWERNLHTLGGIARTPVFLPEQPGHLLVLSEDGRAWIINASNGEVEGPRDLGSPLVEGPALTRGGVSARFADGRVAAWSTTLEPTFYESSSAVTGEGNPRITMQVSPNPRMVLLRRQADTKRTLVSPWTDWRAEVMEDQVRMLNDENMGAAFELEGEWSYVAWEAPKALLPAGRLWVSDEGGLRSYTIPSSIVPFND